MPWWDWIGSLWGLFEKFEDKILSIKSTFLGTLIGVPTIPIMVVTFGFLSLLMLIPHTWSWLNLYLIEWSDEVTDRMSHSDVTIVRVGGLITLLLTIAIVSPFFVTALPYSLYGHIKGNTSSKTTREERAEMERQREAIVTLWQLTTKPTKDFKPKKSIMVHKLDQGIRKQTFISPGVYTREVDHSAIIRDPWGGENNNHRTYTMESYAEHVNREMERRIR